MHTYIHTLNGIVQRFLTGEIDGCAFEREFTDLFDFEEFSDSQIEGNFFQDIRELLEHYTSDDVDLREHPQYYVNERKLRENILQMLGQRK